MRDENRILMAGLVVLCWAVIGAGAFAVEPQRPGVSGTFDEVKEARINALIELPSAEVFERLKGIDYLLDEELANKAVYKAFQFRKEEAIGLALNLLQFPLLEVQRGKRVSRSEDFRVARKVLEVFPAESVAGILSLFKSGDAVTKGNVLRALGNVAGGDAIRGLLIGALEDKTPCEAEDPEMEGRPLRLCDVAYNRLVFRYKIRNVLRAIGPVYRVEVRDYHIAILKNSLKADLMAINNLAE